MLITLNAIGTTLLCLFPAFTLVLVFWLLYEVRASRATLRYAFPPIKDPRELSMLRCPMCGCLNTKVDWWGAAGGTDFHGASAQRCTVCGAITVGDESFKRDLRRLLNIEYMYAYIMGRYKDHILSERNPSQKMLEWFLNYQENKNEIMESYVPKVISRARSMDNYDIFDRVNIVIRGDYMEEFHDADHTNAEDAALPAEVEERYI